MRMAREGGSSGREAEDVVGVAWLLAHPAKIVPIIGTMDLRRITRQARAEAIAPNITRKQWYDIAKAAGMPIP